jgi:hypothetical protein
LPAAAELFALCGIAIAQPILDVFGRAPEVFIEAHASRADLWWFALTVALAPPLALTAVELIVGAVGGWRGRRGVHLIFVGTLGALIAVRAMRLALGTQGPLLLVVAIVVGVLLLVLRARFDGLRQWLVYAAFAPLLFAGSFLFASPAHSLAQPLDRAAAEAVDVVDTDAVRPTVVLLVLDELPVRSLLDADGNIDAERFPGFAAFADDSTWFRNTTTVATHTANAVPAILTGQYPTGTDAEPIAADHPDNVFRLLGNAYRLNVSELDTQLCAVPRCDVEHRENAPTIQVNDPNTVVAPRRTTTNNGSSLATLLRRARAEYPDMIALHDIEALPEVQQNDLVAVSTTTVAPTTTTPPAPVDIGSVPPTTVARGLAKLPTVQPTRFSDWLARIDADVDHPALNMLHLTMPHNPWHLDAGGVSYAFPDDYLHLVGSRGGQWSEDPGATISARQRHLLQVRYVDTLIAALQARLVELGIWDDALVIVTADHGAGFDPGGFFREWDPANQTNLLAVPLLVHGDGFARGVVDDRFAQSVDIVPTIAAAAAITPPWNVDGHSLTEQSPTARTKHPIEATRHGESTLIQVNVAGNLKALLASLPTPEIAGGDDLTILGNGPSGVLIGSKLDTHIIADDSGGTIRLEYPTDHTFAPNENGAVAAFVIGDLDANDLDAAAANRTLVIAVDGTIGATSLTFNDGDHDARFAALLPPAWMVNGPHDVSFFVLGDDGSLAPLTVE